jgi:tryptophan synthase alpha chain
VRASSSVPIVLFGYYNPLLAFGEERLVARASEVGVDGLLVVDLPPEEAGPLVALLRARGMDFVPLVAPTTSDARIDAIAKVADGFLYYVSLTGVTGAGTDLGAAAKRAGALRARTRKPVALGFGVKTPADVRSAASEVDGVVLGSAICSAIESAKSPSAAVDAVRALVRDLRAACKA